jgi:hypothetical protein
MTEATDILLDDNGDIALLNEDLVTGPSDWQHVHDILESYPGSYKQFPLVGVNVTKAVNGPIDGSLRKEIMLQLEADGYSVRSIVLTEQELSIDAQRNG